MKYFIFGTLAFFLIFSQITLAQQWEELNSHEVYGTESTVIGDLGKLSGSFLIQKGMFESPQDPFLGEYYRMEYLNLYQTFERQNTSTVTYYRNNFTLVEEYGPSTVKATVVFSYNPLDSNFIVTEYHYNIDEDGNKSENDDETEIEIDYNLFAEYILTDARTFSEDEDLAKLLNDCFNSMIDRRIKAGEIPDAQYTIEDIYSAGIFQSFANEDTNEEGKINEEEDVLEGTVIEEEGELVEPVPTLVGKSYEIFLKAKNSLGKYALVVVDIFLTKENGEFVFNSTRLRVKFGWQ